MRRANIRDDFQSFDLAVSQWSGQVSANVGLVRRRVAFEVLQSLVRMTPVDTGRARGNWQVTLGETPRGGIEGMDRDGSRTIARGLAEIERTEPGQSIWIHNNLPYIGALERGHSGQALHGMLRVTLNNVEGMFR